MRGATGRGAHLVVVVVALGWLVGGCGGGGDGFGGGTEVRTVTVPADGGGATAPPADDFELAGDDCADARLDPDEDNRSRIERATLCLVNAERTKRDRAALSDNDALTRAARRKARDMVENDYFAHVGPDGRDVRDWVGQTAYLEGSSAHQLGENLGWGSEGGASPARLVQGWMQSSSHRENILRKSFEDSGIGVVLGSPREQGGGGATYVQLFGAR